MLACGATRTRFDLGTTSCWQDVFYGRQRDGLITSAPDDTDELARELAAAWTGEPADPDYYRRLAKKIVTWAAGNPVLYTSDHDDDFDRSDYAFAESIYEGPPR